MIRISSLNVKIYIKSQVHIFDLLLAISYFAYISERILNDAKINAVLLFYLHLRIKSAVPKCSIYSTSKQRRSLAGLNWQVTKVRRSYRDFTMAQS